MCTCVLVYMCMCVTVAVPVFCTYVGELDDVCVYVLQFLF